jgi:hypothetical protein
MTDAGQLAKPAPAPALRLAIGLCAAAVVAMGLWPSPLLEAAQRAARALVP